MRRLLDPSLLDFEKWPKICTENLSVDDAKCAIERMNALKLYFKGTPHREIYAATGLDRRRVWEIVNRAIAVCEDGDIAGFRSCIRFKHIKPYSRSASSRAIMAKASSQGHAGLMLRLLERFPAIAEHVIAEALKVGGRGFAESSIRFNHLHRIFIRECKEVGIPAHDYPFNVENQGMKGLTQFIKRELSQKHLRKMVNASGGDDAARKLGESWSAIRLGDSRQCLGETQMDAYRIDFPGVVGVPNPKGGLPVFLPMERFWLLVIVDTASRAVLGYYVSLARNYSSEDVLNCFEHALLPWRPRQLSIEGLKYSSEGGLPSGVIPELAYSKWGAVALDNAKANCASRVSDRLRDKVGCVIIPGPAGRPERRLCIERIFGTMAREYFQRLPMTTGSCPSDPRRRNPEEVAIRYKVELDELLDLVDVVVADYNGKVTTALFNISPLDYLRNAVAQKAVLLRHIPEDQREGFSLTLLRTPATVRGNVKQGIRPFIRFEGVRYFSTKLGDTPSLIGETLTLECNTRDLRRVRAFLSNGEEFGILEATQSWAYKPHDLRLRKAILRCIATGKIARRDGGDPIADYMRLKERESLVARKPRNELAHAIRVKAEAPPLLPPPKPELVKLIKRNPVPPLKFIKSATNY